MDKRVSLWLSWLERRIWLVRDVTGSSPALPPYFYQYNSPNYIHEFTLLFCSLVFLRREKYINTILKAIFSFKRQTSYSSILFETLYNLPNKYAFWIKPEVSSYFNTFDYPHRVTIVSTPQRLELFSQVWD